MSWWLPRTEQAARQMRSGVKELASVGQSPEGALCESSFSEGNRVELWKEGSLSTSFGESQRLFLGGT